MTAFIGLLLDLGAIIYILRMKPWHSERTWWTVLSSFIFAALVGDVIACLARLLKG